MFSIWLFVLLSVANCQSQQNATFITFNVGLLPSEIDPAQSPGNRTARATTIINALKESNADVICLQEVWLTSVQRQFITELAAVYPYNVNSIVASSTQSPCDPQNVSAPLGACLDPQVCGAAAVSGNISVLLDCVSSHAECEPLLDYFLATPSCYACFSMGVLAGANVFQVAASCTSPTDEYNFSGGQLLLSKRPFTDTLVAPLPSYFMKNVIQGVTEIPAIGKVGMTCTHFDSLDAGTYVPAPGAPASVTSYPELIKFQGQLVQFLIELQRYKALVLQQVLALDANAGPASSESQTGIVQIPEVWNATLDNGLGFWQEAPQKNCTWCSANPTIATRTFLDTVIDHIIYRGFLFLETPQSKVIIGADKALNGSGLWPSDHRGVQLTLRRKSFKNGSNGRVGEEERDGSRGIPRRGHEN